jgi:hypothetical protein
VERRARNAAFFYQPAKTMSNVTAARPTRVRNAFMLALLIIGILLCVASLAADNLGFDLTPGFGVLQMFLLLLGISCLTVAGYVYLYSLRSRDAPRSLQADIGIRLSATGLVLAYVAGLADLFRIGTHVMPNFERPYVGLLQLGGLLLGIVTIIAGMALYHSSRGSHLRESSSVLELFNGRNASGE